MKSGLYSAYIFPAIIVLLTIYSVDTLASNEIYKCTVNGKPVFTDKPCDGGKSVNVGITNSSMSISNVAIKVPRVIYASDEWFEDSAGFYEAETIAKASKAKMIIYFRTDWCPYCIAVDTNILADPEAQEAIEKYVKVKINPDHGAAEMALFKEMNGKGYPRFLVRSQDNAISTVSVTPGKNNKNKNRKNISVAEFIDNMSKF
jgi:thiol-disulfide isomerase/thioredoxin